MPPVKVLSLATDSFGSNDFADDRPLNNEQYESLLVCYGVHCRHQLLLLPNPTSRQFVWNIVRCTIMTFAFVLLVIFIGAELEQVHVRKAMETTSFYNARSDVCAFEYPSSELGARPLYQETEETPNNSLNVRGKGNNPNETITSLRSSRKYRSNITHVSLEVSAVKTLDFVTYATKEDVIEIRNKENEDIVVAHCGECGACSNPHDINIYDVTKNSLFGTTTACAKQGLFWGRDSASECMEKNAGLTKGCTDCWVDNIMCDLRKCVFTCLRYGLFNPKKQTGTKSLNPCTLCDEKRCGPAFVACAGANRRRSGIRSDIARDANKEICSRADPTWWRDPNLRTYYEETISATSENDD